MQAAVIFIYGLLLLVGGLIGHLKANSLPSLIMGTTFAILAIASAYAIFKGYISGTISALVISLILSLFFFYRLIATQRFMPSGLMAVISVMVLAYLIYTLKKTQKRSIT